MTMIAYAFLQSRRLKQAGGGKKNPQPAAPTEPTRRQASHPHRPQSVVPTAAEPSPLGICQSSARVQPNGCK